MKELKAKQKIIVEKFHCNNTYKNCAFCNNLQARGTWYYFKYILPGIPQQNGQMEQKFISLFDWVCALLNWKNFMDSWRHVLWDETTNTVMQLEHCGMKKWATWFPTIFGRGETKILLSLQKFGEKCIWHFQGCFNINFVQEI